jgi:hypothetical protein
VISLDHPSGIPNLEDHSSWTTFNKILLEKRSLPAKPVKFAEKLATWFPHTSSRRVANLVQRYNYNLRVLPFHCMHYKAQFSTVNFELFFPTTRAGFPPQNRVFPLQVACLAFSLHELGTVFLYKLLAVFPTTRIVFPPQYRVFLLQVACLAFPLHASGTVFHYKLRAVFSHYTQRFVRCKIEFSTTSCVFPLSTCMHLAQFSTASC